MSIFERIKRLSRANINDALDRIESPEKNLKQRIREIEEAMKEAKNSAASFAVSFKKTEKEQEQLKRLKAEWERRAEQAIKLSDDPAAKQALEAKIKIEERLREIEPNFRRSSETYRQLRENIEKLNNQLSDSKMRMAELVSRQQAASAQKSFNASLGKSSALASESDEFRKMEEHVLHKEAEAEIEQDIRGEMSGIEDTIAKQSRKLQVDSELEELKKRVKKS